MGKKHRRPEPHSTGSPLQKALALHQAGRFAEAEAVYRTLSSNPNALQLLGVLLCQTGRTSEGVGFMEKAVELSPTHTEALSNLGVAYHDLGRFDEALSLLDRALSTEPNRPDLLDKRGFVLQDLNRHQEAVDSFQKSLNGNPNVPDTWLHLGNSLQATGDYKEAEQAFRTVLKFLPRDHEAWTNLGNALQAQGNAEQAIAAYRRSLESAPTADGYHNLAAALMSIRDEDGALKAARTAIQLQPKLTAHYLFLGDVYEAFGNTPEAVQAYRKALEIDPDNFEVRVRLGIALNNEGRFSEAQSELSLASSSGPAQLVSALAVPVIPMTVEEIEEGRARVLQSLSELKEQKLKIDDPVRQLGRPSFYWSYHSESELPMQRALVSAYTGSVPDLLWQSPYLEEKRSGKIRLGVLCSLLRKHTIGKLFLRLVAGLSNEDVEVVFFDAASQTDDWSHELAAKVDESYRITPDLDRSRRFIAEKRLDALFYPEIGMDPFIHLMAFSRLAPLQFMTWGHPVSTALPHMDSFLSSQNLEREGSEIDYSEKLVKLPSLQSVFRRPATKKISRADLGLPEDRHIYACPQTLFKLHPDMDQVFAEILRRDEKGLIALITGQEAHWDELIQSRFQQTMPDVADRILFMRRLNQDEYIGLCENADVVLDTFYFSGGNSSLEAFSVGAPIVTWPGKMLRGRITLAQYKAMEIEDLVADSPNHFEDLALQVAQNKDLHQALKQRILERNEALYDNPKPIEELRVFLLGHCRT